MLWFPHAKINLGLAVLNKRKDGFHSIESLLHPIKLFDILEIIENQNSDNLEDELFLSGLSLDISTEENLVWKALQLLRKRFDFPSVKIHLHKQIPSGSGLGGGSSDAAHTLFAINQLFNLQISKNRLAELASEIGSDCPFFNENKSQYVKGRGELLESFELNQKPLKLFLVIPDFSVSTQRVYSKIKPKPNQKPPIEILKQPIKNWKTDLKNDFEEVVFKDFPLLSELKEELYRRAALYVSMSGSGSGIYALFSDEIKIQLPENYTSYWMNFPY